MTIKEYSEQNSDISLNNLKVKTPKGVIGYWKSQWTSGVWLSDGKTNRIYPQFIESLLDCMNWEVTDEEVNCDKLTGLEYTDTIDEN